MGRKQSKRITLKRKHKIEKKITDHHKKLKKLSKNVKKKKRVDPGIPNSLPFKEEILKEVALKKQQIKDEQEKKKEERRLRKAGQKKGDGEATEPMTLEQLSRDAVARGEIFESSNQTSIEEIPGDICDLKSRKYYFKEFKKVLLASDVIIEVLDARDPLSCRCPTVETEIKNCGKKLILLLNKIDLTPKKNVSDWLDYLRREFPTLPFKASTQHQRRKLGRSRIKFIKATPEMLGNSKEFGAETLFKLLGNYARNDDLNQSITIGVIGLPNVGKSSVINSLKRAKACSVGDRPGVTRSMQEIQLDSKLRLLDSPGVLLQNITNTASLVLRNCVPLEKIQDLTSVVEYMVSKMAARQIMERYAVGMYANTNELLSELAYKRGLLKKRWNS